LSSDEAIDERCQNIVQEKKKQLEPSQEASRIKTSAFKTEHKPVVEMADHDKENEEAKPAVEKSVKKTFALSSKI
jgi:hypothetical protein